MIELVVQDKPVIRYDSAHGFAHIDRYNLKGKQKKERLNMDFDKAFTMGQRNLFENWQRYREQFLKGQYP